MTAVELALVALECSGCQPICIDCYATEREKYCTLFYFEASTNTTFHITDTSYVNCEEENSEEQGELISGMRLIRLV